MDALISFFGAFGATWVLTMAALALIIVLRSDSAEEDRRGMLSQLASLLGWLGAASMPLFAALFVFQTAEGAAHGGHDYALVGIVAGAIQGFWLLGKSALWPKKNKQANKPW